MNLALHSPFLPSFLLRATTTFHATPIYPSRGNAKNLGLASVCVSTVEVVFIGAIQLSAKSGCMLFNLTSLAVRSGHPAAEAMVVNCFLK